MFTVFQLKCLKRTIDSNERELLPEDIEYAMNIIVPSVSRADKIKYENVKYVNFSFRGLYAKVVLILTKSLNYIINI